MSFPVDLTAGNLGLDCYPEPQEFYEAAIAATTAELDATFSGFVMSPTRPEVDDQDKLWFNTTDGRLYFFTNGDWYTRHPRPPGPNGERMPWVGTEADLWDFDGGDGTDPGVSAPTEFSGAMWEVDHTYDGRIPMAPGTIPGTSDTISAGVNDGAAEVELSVEQLPGHQHIVPVCAIKAQNTDPDPGVSPATVQYGIGKDQGSGNVPDDSSGSFDRAFPLTSEASTESPPAQEAVSLIPPVRGTFMAKRTARRYIKAA